MTNTFVSFGVKSGVIGVALLITLLVCAHRRLGCALETVRTSPERALTSEFMLWAGGVMLTVHIVNWLGITYFDQFYVIWFMHLAIISNLSDACIGPVVAQADYNGSEIGAGSQRSYAGAWEPMERKAWTSTS